MPDNDNQSTVALADFPTATIKGQDSALTVPCEPVTDGLAITPCLDFGENPPRLGGGFTLTHTPTGRALTPGQACLECVRETGRRLAATGVRWPDVDATDNRSLRATIGAHYDTVIAALLLLHKCEQRMCFIESDDEPCGACGMVRQHADYCMHVVLPMVAVLNGDTAGVPA